MAEVKKTTKKVRNDLPHNSDAERAVLGSALLSKEALYSVLSALEEQDFYEGKHQILYRVLTVKTSTAIFLVCKAVRTR